MAPLKAGDVAPDFDVAACTGDHKHRVTLSEFRGKKNVVLAFYPLDWTPA
jgi:peroxiredoxin